MKNSVLIRNLLSSLIAALLFTVLVSLAQAGELTVENNTGRAVVELSLSKPGVNIWGDSLLAPDTAIAAGESVSVPVGDDLESADLRALLDNGGQELYSNIDFQGLSRIKLNSQGTVVVE